MSDRDSPHFPGGTLKTAAKLLILEWYLDEYVKIMRKNWSDEIWYVDTHAGSGRTLCNNGVHIDGSPLRVLEKYADGFDRFYLYELSQGHFNTLLETITDRFGYELEVSPIHVPDADFPVARCDEPYIRIMNLDSNDGVSFLADASAPNSHWFTFIDPAGLTARKDTLDTLIERENMDILINYQTSGVRRNAGAAAEHAHSAVEGTVGEGGWPPDASEDELADLYVERLSQHPEWDVRSKDMTDPREPTHRFDLVFASANQTAHKIMEYIMTERDDLWSEAAKEIGYSGLDDFG